MLNEQGHEHASSLYLNQRKQKTKQRQYPLPALRSCGLSHLASWFLSTVGCDCMINTFLDFICSTWLISPPPQKKGYKNWNYFPPKADHRNCSLCVLELAMETLSGLSFTSCQRGLSIPWKKERCIEAKKTEKTDRPCWVFSPSLLRVGDTVKSS